MEGIPPVLSDKEQLEYVFNNILSSICDFIPEKGEVAFSAKMINLAPGEKIQLSLPQSPNGHAVELSISYPGDAERGEISSHYSIELFLAQQIVDMNLGVLKIVASSEKTTVVMKLPAASERKG